jgi:hypothetical protein
MLFNCSRGIVQLPIVFENRERPWFEKIEKCFPFFIRRKTLSFDKVAFLVWSELSFPYCYQTWENKKSEF